MTPTPRDFFANERTFLAYVRTALAFIGFGFVIARFALFAREFAVTQHVVFAQTSVAVPLGIAMTIAGVVVAGFGVVRYIAQDRALRKGSSSALLPRDAIVFAASVAICGVLVAVGLLQIR